MINIENNVEFEDEFVVLDDDDNPVTGLIQNNFTVLLYDPDEIEVSANIGLTISEIGNGIYKFLFTPNKLGNWEMVIYHTTYFPWGKSGHYKVIEASNDTLFTYLKRTLGLCQENFRVFDPTYDKGGNLLTGKIKTYPSATDVDNDTNAIAEYEVKTTYGIGKFRNNPTGYKVKKNRVG